jgi:DNA-binding transcriptional LysR family regulator
MLAVAATHHLGVALMPRLLIAGELARGELVVACPKALRGTRGYYLITPDLGPEPEVLTRFRTWVQQEAQRHN